MDLQTEVVQHAKNAKRAFLSMIGVSTEAKNAALRAISEALDQDRESIFAANRIDLSKAEGLAAPLLKRLRFDTAKLDETLRGIGDVIGLPDPSGKVLSARELDRGLDLYQVSSPIGLIAMIFESRPDALVQMAALAVKSGNALLLKGGSEAKETNRALAGLIYEAGCGAGLPEHWLHLVESRAEIDIILGLDGIVDLIVPRGSNEFVRYIMRHSTIPVMGHADGICHVYVDQAADLDMAIKIVVDSKTQYVAVCNAAETLLVHAAIAARAVPAIISALVAAKVEVRAADNVFGYLDDTKGVVHARDSDWGAEYLDYIMSVRVVESLEEAITYINTHGSHHTDSIVTGDAVSARAFMERVDSAGVFWNASTRFADGYKYGLGAEVGISTGKLHARGPVGLEGLVTYKYKLFGSGQIAADYTGNQGFIHRELDSEKEPW